MSLEAEGLQASHSKDGSVKLPWKLKFISSVPLAIKNDTEKEDKQAAVRASWESNQPGRAAKAKRLRDRYLNSRCIPASDNPISDAASDFGHSGEQLVILPPSRMDRRVSTPVMPRSGSLASTNSLPNMLSM